MGFIQTETPYYQPNPPAGVPYPPVTAYNDPVYTTSTTGNTANALGVRVTGSAQDITVYGAGLYSFFDNYDVYCLSTVGVTDMISYNGNAEALYSDNLNGFVDTIAYFPFPQVI
jgi:glucan 1,3-beta-glucosidase